MTLLLSSTSTVISQYYNIQVSYTTPRTSDFIYSCNLYPFPHMSRKCKHNSRSIPASTLRGCTSVVFWLKVQWNTLQTRTNLFRFPLSAMVSFVAAVFVISKKYIYIYKLGSLLTRGLALLCSVSSLSAPRMCRWNCRFVHRPSSWSEQSHLFQRHRCLWCIGLTFSFCFAFRWVLNKQTKKTTQYFLVITARNKILSIFLYSKKTSNNCWTVSIWIM